jgi:3-methyladenine DNA glycosylase Mpg
MRMSIWLLAVLWLVAAAPARAAFPPEQQREYDRLLMMAERAKHLEHCAGWAYWAGRLNLNQQAMDALTEVAGQLADAVPPYARRYAATEKMSVSAYTYYVWRWLLQDAERRLREKDLDKNRCPSFAPT